MFIQTFLITKT